MEHKMMEARNESVTADNDYPEGSISAHLKTMHEKEDAKIYKYSCHDRNSKVSKILKRRDKAKAAKQAKKASRRNSK